ncbi:hypothetical protein [Haloferax sp. DFSO52]|uniref:hypothetical protein n=1 Tax=Haloferax sp. DFSO52 TaxID=3388505 RepID=UPI003A867887
MSNSNTGFDPNDASTDRDTRYRFFPVVRRGYPPEAYYEGKEARDSEELDTAGSLEVDFEVIGLDGSATTSRSSSVDIELYGPGHVTGIDGRQVVRMEPEPGTSNYPPNYFATVEFDAADLPWLFSPVSDDTLDPSVTSPTGKGFPWCCLVVVEKTDTTTITPAGSDRPLPSITVPPSELPPLDEAWAWAHAQVVGSPKQKSNVSLAEVFRTESTLTRSRLVSPRNLQQNTSYVAAVVPTFDAGVRAGLGESADRSPEETEGQTTMSLAWPLAETAFGDRPNDEPMELPMLHHWEFSTGQQGDFEYLARQLEPRDLNVDSYDIGVRTVDTSDPGPAALEVWGDDVGEAERTVRMGGALRKANSSPITAAEYEKHEVLRSLLNEAGTIEEWADESYEAVGPPIYGGRHAQAETLPTSIDDDQRWLWDLNLNPGNRLAAAVGADIVRDKQEQLMTSAWEQVGDVRAANRRLAAASLSREAMETALDDLADAPTGWLASFTGPMHDRLLANGQTVGAQLDASTLPSGVTSVPFRRLLSGSGRLSKRLGSNVDVGDIVSELASGDLDVVTPSPGPAGMGTVLEGADLEKLCRKLPEPPESTSDNSSKSDRPESVESLLETIAKFEETLDTLLTLLAELSTAVAERNPADYWTEKSPIPSLVDDVEDAWDTVRMLADLIDRPMLEVSREEEARDLPEVDDEFTENRARTLHDRLGEAVAGQLLGITPEETETLEAVSDARDRLFVVRSILADIMRYLDAPAVGSPVAYLDGLLCDSVPAKTDRPDPDLAAAANLDPVSSLVDRLDGMLGGLDLTGPNRSDPFDRVMAYPEFPKPTYDDLAAVSEDYLLPGVSELPKNTFGALETNPEFIESFLVGMNHEMASELLWRRYPTDRRGSYFRQFWDPSARIPKPEDESLLKDITEIHTWDDKGPSNIGRSELGSNVMSGAGGSSADPAGQGPDPNSQVVVVVRGELLQRYPTTTIYATKAKLVPNADGTGSVRVPEWPTPNEKAAEVDTAFHRFPIFRGRLDPDVSFLGFDLTAEEATGETPMASVGDPRPDDSDHWVNDDGTDDLGWFFVMAEPPGEVRFGLDADQDDAGTTPPGITDASGTTSTTDDPDENPEHGWSALSWGHLVDDAASLADKRHVSVYRDRPGEGGWETKSDTPWVADGSATITAEQEAVWGKNSAHMAYITWQRPVRIAIHADDLLPVGGNGDSGGTNNGI